MSRMDGVASLLRAGGPLRAGLVIALLCTACSKPSSQRPGPSPADAAEAPLTVKIGHGGGCPDRGACEDGCNSGDAEQCRRLGDAFEFETDGGHEETRAAAAYVRACELGSIGGCLSAGHMYEYHRGVAKDDTRAAGFYRQGCDRGDVTCCVNYAIMLENGRGVATDVPSALRYYHEGCVKKVGLACDRELALGGAADGAAKHE